MRTSLTKLLVLLLATAFVITAGDAMAANKRVKSALPTPELPRNH